MSNVVRVWILPVDLPPETAARCRDVLDDGERARAAAFCDPRDRQRFAIAHGALRLLAGRAVGVDIQHLVPSLDPVALSVRFFPADEAGYVAAGPDAVARADRFGHLWARKEAVVKAAGGRLWPNLAITVHRRDVVTCADPAVPCRVTDLPAPEGFRAAVALTGTAPFALTATLWPAAAPALAS